MSENIPFPYVSYKGKKYADPHAAAKAFLLDTTKTSNDTLNIHDISDTSSIDGAGVDINGKIWTNNYSFQDHPSVVGLKSAMKDVFSSIKEVMIRNNQTLEQVAQEPMNVRPFYAYNGKRYDNADEVFTVFHNDPNKVEHQSSVMYHNRFDTGGIELAGVGPNKETWYTQLSDYADIPAVKASKVIFDQIKIEAPAVLSQTVEVESIKEEKPFTPHFKFDGNTYNNGKDAMQAFLDKPAEQRFGSVILHTKDQFSGIEMAGQSHNAAKTVWVDRMSDNDANPVVVAARKEMNEVLDTHNIKFPPMNPNAVEPPKVVEAFKPYFKFDGMEYSTAKDAMQAFLDKPANERYSGVILHTKDDFSGIEMAGQSHDLAKTVWIDRMSHNNSDPFIVAARKEMNDVLNAHNTAIDFSNAEIATDKQPEFPYFKYDNKVYKSANDVMKVFIADRDNNSIKSDVHLHIDNHFNSVDAAGHDRNGDIWKNQYSFQDHPAMKDFKNAFDKQVNSYKVDLKYLDEVYADNAKIVDGYPREVQIEEMKEMKKIIDKLPTHNISDTDMIKIQSYKNDIKNHELSVFLENGSKNNDVKVKNNTTLKIS